MNTGLERRIIHAKITDGMLVRFPGRFPQGGFEVDTIQKLLITSYAHKGGSLVRSQVGPFDLGDGLFPSRITWMQQAALKRLHQVFLRKSYKYTSKANEAGERELRDIPQNYAAFTGLLRWDRHGRAKLLTGATEPSQPSDMRRFMADHKKLDDQGRRIWGPQHLDTGIETTDNQGQLWTVKYELKYEKVPPAPPAPGAGGSVASTQDRLGSLKRKLGRPAPDSDHAGQPIV